MNILPEVRGIPVLTGGHSVDFSQPSLALAKITEHGIKDAIDEARLLSNQKGPLTVPRTDSPLALDLFVLPAAEARDGWFRSRSMPEAEVPSPEVSAVVAKEGVVMKELVVVKLEEAEALNHVCD